MDINNKKIIVGFSEITIKEEEASFRKDNLTDCYGQFLQRENLIQINTKLEKHDKFNTLIHEILHSCVYVSGLNQKGAPLEEDSSEEIVVNNLTNMFHAVLRDNPWLITFINEYIPNKTTKEK